MWFNTKIPVAFTICSFNMLGKLKQCIGHTNTAWERQGWYLPMARPWANHFPFLCLFFFPLIICVVYFDRRHFGAACSPALCLWRYTCKTCACQRSELKQELRPAGRWCEAKVRNGTSRELSREEGQIACKTRACLGCKGPRSELFVAEKWCWLCSMTHLLIYLYTEI